MRMRAGRQIHLIHAFGPGQPIANKVDAYFQDDPGGYKDSNYRWMLCEMDRVFYRLFGESRNRDASASEPNDTMDYNTLNDQDIRGRAGRFGRENSATFDLVNGDFPDMTMTEAQICQDYAMPAAMRWVVETKEEARQNAPWHRR